MSSTPPKLILFIPQLFKPLALWKQDFGFIPNTPVFSTLLQATHSQNTSSIGFERSLFSALGLSTDHELPIARYRYQDNNQICHHKWKTLICADPVHCEVGMNDITLTHSIDDLTTQESAELIDLLNQHFVEDGLTFLLDGNNNWYLALSDKDVIKSSPLDDVRGKNIFPYLPQSDSRNWQQIHNEVQMLLHMSSLNQSREIAGVPVINSLWFWGGGERLSSDIKFKTTYGGANYISTIGTSFAQAAKSTWLELPESGQDIIDSVALNQQTRKIETIVILDQLIKPAMLDNLDEWQQQVSIIEKKYIKPLMDSWESNQISIEIDTCNGQRVTPEKSAVLHTWFKKITNQPARSLLDIKL